MKTCKNCNETKSADYFYPTTGNTCKACHNLYSMGRFKEKRGALKPRLCNKCSIEISRPANQCAKCKVIKRREDRKKYTQSQPIKKIAKEMREVGCSECGWNKSKCDIHHINGRKVDDKDGLWNLSYLCPNCHRLAHDGVFVPKPLSFK